MTRRALVGLATLTLLASTLTALAQQDMKEYYLGLIYRGPTWTPEPTEEVMELQRQHLANIRRLAEEGKMVMAGPFGDDGDLRGLFLFKADSMEEAKELVATDPMVKSGRLEVELHPWWGPARLEELLQPAD